MKKWVGFLLVIVVLGVVLWALSGPLQRPEVVAPVEVPLVELLPADTLAFYESRRPFAVWERSPYKRFFEEMAALDWEEYIPLLMGEVESATAELFFDTLDEFKQHFAGLPYEGLLGNEMVLAIYGRMPEFQVLLLSRLEGERGERAWADLSAFLPATAEKYPWVTYEDPGTGDPVRLTFNQFPEREITLHVGRQEDVLLVGMTPEALLLDLSAPGAIASATAAPRLAENSVYQSLQAAQPEDADVRVYAYVEPLTGFLKEYLDARQAGAGPSVLDPTVAAELDMDLEPLLVIQGYQSLANQIARAVWLDPLLATQAMMQSVKVEDDGSLSALTVQLVNSTETAGMEMTSEDFTKYVPVNAQAFSYSARNQFVEMVREIRSILESEPAGQDLLRTVEQFQEDTGIDIEKDLLSWMTGGAGKVTLSASQAGAMMSGVGRQAILIETDDPEAARAGLNRLAERIAEEWKLEMQQVDGVTTLGLPLGGGQAGVDVRGNYAVIALGSRVPDIVDEIFADREVPFWETEEWESVADIRHEPYASMSVVNLEAQWRGIAQLGQSLPLLSIMVLPQLPSDEARERAIDIISVLQEVLPVFEELSPMKRQIQVKWLEDGKIYEREYIEVERPPEPSEEAADTI